MTIVETLGDQLRDPFRWGLLVALVLTMLRTEGQTGRWLPLALGALFVAVIIPATRPGGDVLRSAAVGLAANALILAAVLLLREGWVRLRR